VASQFIFDAIGIIMSNTFLKSLGIVFSLSVAAPVALAKLPPPSDEAKAKSAEAAAKTAWNGKMEGFLLCKAQDKVVAHYKKVKVPAKDAKAAGAAPAACTDPGPFKYTPPDVAAADPAKKS
jgi:hypothetical protein